MQNVRNRFTISDTRILGLIESCVKDVENWGFKLPKEIIWKSCKCNNRLGLASYKTNTITLSSFLFKESKDDNIKNTIYHELCHLIAGPGTHHGPEWKKIAKVVSEKSGLEISRLAKCENYDYFKSEEHQSQYKYEFKCTKCGCTLKYQKYTKFVDTYNDTLPSGKPRWTCSCCGGTFVRTK